MKGLVVMFRILLPLVVFFGGFCRATDNDLIRGLSDQFSHLTRANSKMLPPSDSVYALDKAARGSPDTSLAAFIESSGSSPEPDSDYAERMELLQQQMRAAAIESRSFDKGGLANYIIKELHIQSSELDRSAGTVFDQINAVEKSINVLLKTLQSDLERCLKEGSPSSASEVLVPDQINRRYKDSIEIITSTLYLSQSVSEDMLNLTLRYFILNVMGVLGENCKFGREDTHESWKKKSDIMQRNAGSLRSLFLPKFRADMDNIINPVLARYYDDSCDFFTKWYKDHRSTWSQGLQYLGARDSNTKKLFEEFDTSFRAFLRFVLDDPVFSERIRQRKERLLADFNGTDQKFAEGVSSVGSYFSWGASSSNATQTTSIVSPQPVKSSATSGWGWW